MNKKYLMNKKYQWIKSTHLYTLSLIWISLNGQPWGVRCHKNTLDTKIDPKYPKPHKYFKNVIINSETGWAQGLRSLEIFYKNISRVLKTLTTFMAIIYFLFYMNQIPPPTPAPPPHFFRIRQRSLEGPPSPPQELEGRARSNPNF